MSSMAATASDTGSRLVAQWAGLYRQEPTPGLSLAHADGGAAEPTAAAASAAAATSPTSAGSDGSPPPHRRALAGVEVPRVGKPAARRRSRASRRAPVTLLNTDTANFRAMVQQFTGIPAPNPFAAAGPGHGGGGVPLINFGADYGAAFPPPAGLMSFDHLLQQSAPFPDGGHLLRPPPQQQYTGTAFSYGNPHASGDVFAHGGRETAEDRMLLQSMQAAQMPTTAANHSINGYFA